MCKNVAVFGNSDNSWWKAGAVNCPDLKDQVAADGYPLDGLTDLVDPPV